MDPLSTISSVTSVIDIVARTTTALGALITDWKNAPAAILALSNEAADLTIVLDRLRDASLVARQVDAQRDAEVVSALDEQFRLARDALAELDALVSALRRRRGLTRRNEWILKKSAAARLQQRIRAVRSKINDIVLGYTMYGLFANADSINDTSNVTNSGRQHLALNLNSDLCTWA